MDTDQTMLDPNLPGNKDTSLRHFLERKQDSAQEAYQAASFWWCLLEVNPHLQQMCSAQIEAQHTWCSTLAEEARAIHEHICKDGKAHAWATSIKEAAEFWATETQVLYGRAMAYNPDNDAPVWAARRIEQLQQYDFVKSAMINAMLVAILPAIGRGGLLQPLITQTTNGLKPLDLVDDRTVAQKAEDGDLEPVPTHCDQCGSVLVMRPNKVHPYLYCTMCSNQAKYYTVLDSEGRAYLDPNPPQPRAAKKGIVH